MFSLKICTFTILAWTIGPAIAQRSATCTDATYRWAFNKEGVSPCQVGESLGGQCTTIDFTIQALPAGFYYSGMDPAFATPCVCNTVYYSLLSVCALCQGGFADAWPDWSRNCTDPLSTYPDPIPARTGVPHWAYLPLNVNGTINVLAAKADTGPEAIGTTTSIPRTSATGKTTTTDIPQANKTSKKAPIGAIVGGVVGGLVFIGLVVGLVVFLVLRQRNEPKNIPPPAPFISDVNGAPPLGPMPLLDKDNRYSYVPTTPLTPYTEKAYNPDDPSTFPTGPMPPTTPPLVQPYDGQMANANLRASFLGQRPDSLVGTPPYPPYDMSMPQPMSMPNAEPLVSELNYASPLHSPSPMMIPHGGASPQYRGVPEV